jgi:2-polyprenyl-3-methyl-5-hydroxy-6-metoxy-1,4-benzoquinol methylase
MTTGPGSGDRGPDTDVVSIYDTKVDREGPESAHTAALELVGWNKRVLEVGCAGGHVTTALVEQGCTVVGVEIDPRAAAAAERVAEHVVVGDIDTGDIWAELEGQRFDVVLLGDVLEHLRDPLEALRRFTNYLGPEGVVVISLPNIAHGDVRLTLLGGVFPYRATGLLDRTHLHFFTRDTALELMEQAGLVPVTMRRIVMPLFTTELAVPRHGADPSVVAALLEDPDAETYQFVFAAVRDGGDARVRRALARLLRLEDELRLAEARLAVAQAEGAEATRTSAELREERDAARRDAADASAAVESERAAGERSRNEWAAQVAKATAELAALRSTRTFRWSRLPRWLYGRLRRPVPPR